LADGEWSGHNQHVSCWFEKEGSIRIYPSKVISGQWRFYADGEWLSVFND
jgi:hypothetical protein